MKHTVYLMILDAEIALWTEAQIHSERENVTAGKDCSSNNRRLSGNKERGYEHSDMCVKYTCGKHIPVSS